MNFLKNLFGGGIGGSGEKALYLYVRPKRCEEILKVRIDLVHQLSQTDEGYFTRKLATATRCPFQAEIRLTFDSNKTLIAKEVDNGEFVSEAEYTAQISQPMAGE